MENKSRGIGKVLIIMFLGSLFMLAYYYKEGRITLASFKNLRDPYCNIPIKIILGDVDTRFNLGNETILKELETASRAWENNYSKDLFTFEGTSKGKVVVNFIYDARQEETLESEKARSLLRAGWERYEEMASERKILANRYESLQSTYDSAVKNYNTRLASYENKVREWNRKQGTESEYRALKAEGETIDQMFESLEKQRIFINNLAAQINESNEEIQSVYAKLIMETNEYNRQFSSDEPITVGEYDGTYYINIYQFTDLAQLRITLAHELGHSLGMDHTENEKSIMFPLQSKQAGDSLLLTEEDRAEFQRVCK